MNVFVQLKSCRSCIMHLLQTCCMGLFDFIWCQDNFLLINEYFNKLLNIKILLLNNIALTNAFQCSIAVEIPQINRFTKSTINRSTSHIINNANLTPFLPPSKNSMNRVSQFLYMYIIRIGHLILSSVHVQVTLCVFTCIVGKVIFVITVIDFSLVLSTFLSFPCYQTNSASTPLLPSQAGELVGKSFSLFCSQSPLAITAAQSCHFLVVSLLYTLLSLLTINILIEFITLF